ncbi:MAG: S49 family peptidase [Candidatus Eisenbacteria bacterium]
MRLWTVWSPAACFLAAFLILGLTASESHSSPYASPSSIPDLDPLVSAPGVSDSPLAGLYNPAAWPIVGRGGVYLGWDDFQTDTRGSRRADLGAFSDHRFRGVVSFQHLGLGLTHTRPELYDDDRFEYVAGLGFGNRSTSSGISYTWTRGGNAVFGKTEKITSGSVQRCRYGSLGLVRAWDKGPGPDYWQADLGFRPVGPRLTFFADVWKSDEQDWKKLPFGLGAEVDVVPGVTAALRYQPERDGAAWWGGSDAVSPGDYTRPEQWSFRVELAPSRGMRGSYRSTISSDSELARTFALEFVESPNLAQWLYPPRAYPTLDLGGPVVYQNYRWFDDRTRLLGLLGRIARYAESPEVEGVVVKMSGLRMSFEGLWEVRSQLAALHDRGKKVIVHFDRLGLGQYVLATVADQIWMDPQGDLEVTGVHFGRTYYQRALEKAGVGFDELRFFTYKSAVETFSRTSLSDADREQLSALLDDFYEEAVAEIVTSRGLTRDAWDRIVDDRGMVFPREAMELGLVDSVGTFEDARKAAPKAARRNEVGGVAATLGALHGDPIWAPEEWGEPPRIALLYAIGPCDMDTGIRGRTLSKAVKKAAGDRTIRAIVLRVDSPGGDPLPSDLVARELREASKKKPVIISQGQVAASGGYWLSMYGDEILVSPFTVTGSIGVILAHVWDDSLGTKIGWDYDGISRGKSADLMRGPAVPLIGASMPHRPMSAEERARAELLIRQLYGDFVSAVAEGRDMEESAVDAIGQGRVWSGRAGIANGLADGVGGLWDGLALAKERAGIRAIQEIAVVEGPEVGLFRPDFLTPKLLGLGAGAAEKTSLSRLEARLGQAVWSGLPAPEQLHLGVLDRHLGKPLILAPPFGLLDGDPDAVGP